MWPPRFNTFLWHRHTNQQSQIVWSCEAFQGSRSPHWWHDVISNYKNKTSRPAMCVSEFPKLLSGLEGLHPPTVSSSLVFLVLTSRDKLVRLGRILHSQRPSINQTGRVYLPDAPGNKLDEQRDCTEEEEAEWSLKTWCGFITIHHERFHPVNKSSAALIFNYIPQDIFVCENIHFFL